MRRGFTFCRILTVAVALAPPAAGAQVVTSIDAGVATVDYQNTPREGALTVTPAVRLDGSGAAFSVSGTVSMFQGGDWGAQGLVAGSAFTPVLGPVRGELSLSANAVAFRDFADSWQYLAQARAHVHSASRGVWLGAGGGHTRIATTWVPLALFDAGVWAQAGYASLRGIVSHASYSGSDGSDIWLITGDRLAVSDVSGALTLARHRVAVELSAGARAGDRRYIGSWGSVVGTLWFSEHIAGIASVGTYLSDPLQRLPGGSFAMLQMRVTSRPPAEERAAEWGARATEFAISAARDSTDRLRTVRVRAPGARSVELLGDITDWRPIPLVRTVGDLWRVELPIAPGTYRMSLRVNGGPWLAPPGVPARSDEFSGQVGVVVVP